MTVPLWCLVVAIALPPLWAVCVEVFRKRQFGAIDNHHPRAQAAALEGAGARARGAEQNAWEALPTFMGCVLIAHVAGADPTWSAVASGLFVAVRVAHGFLYIADLAPLRSLSYLAGMACCGWLVVLAALA